ncbi:MAG: fatty acid desaturase, partial [Myxococcota bacterium]
SVWVHEGSHGHVAKARRLNDALTNWLFAGPVGITVASYRSRHQDHHDHLGTAQDSERHPRTCIRGGRLWGELGRALSGLFAYRLLFAYNDDKHRDPAGMAVAVATQGIIAVACWFFGHWLMYPVLWAAPLLTIAVTLTAFRAIAEHQPRSLDSTPGAEEPIGAWTRSIDSNPVERWLLAPLGFNRHLEHEVFPGVPFYRLEDAHQALAASGGLDEADRWHRGSYVSLLRSLSRG